MSKTTTIIIALLVALAAFIGFKVIKDSKSSLPANHNQPTDLTSFDFQDWHEFASPTGKFKVLFPSLPQHATENVDDPKTLEKKHYDTYVSAKDNGTIFMISIVTFKDSDINSQEEASLVLKEMMNDMVASNPNNKLVRSEIGNYKGNPSLDFTLENTDLALDAKTFVAGDTLYVLSRIIKPKDQSRDEFLFFINSFELTPNISQTVPRQTKIGK